MFEYIVKLAGIALLMMCVANFFCFEKLGWSRNLAKTEVFFQQVFRVHVLYIVLTMAGMGLACLFATEELVAGDTLMARGFAWFGTLFWGGRIALHLFYYNQKVKQDNPYWNVLFLTTFFFLALTFVSLGLNVF